MVNCPFCQKEMTTPSTAILETNLKEEVIVTKIRRTYCCVNCNARIERTTYVRTDVK